MLADLGAWQGSDEGLHGFRRELLQAQSAADFAVARAQANILAAKDQAALQIALQAGTDAIAVFAKVLATYNVPVQPAPPSLPSAGG